MGKTRRKLYGRVRRRQRGGGRLWWTLLAALAAAKGAKAEDPRIRELASNWWFEGGWGNSKALADGLTKAIPTFTLPDRIFDVKADALWDAPPPATEMSEDQKGVVEPYLTEEVDLKGLKYGPTYEWNGQQFEYDTWSNKGDTVEITTGDGTVLTDVPITARFKVVSVPPEDDVEGGRRRSRVSRVSRKQRRKTLRRK
jgi:hypothetical protein